MLKRLLIAGVITSATFVSVPAAAHSLSGERIAAEIILHSVFGDRHVHRHDSHNDHRVTRRNERYRASLRAERLRLELAQARQAYRQALRREYRRNARQQARFEHRRDARRDRHELAALRIREAQLSAQLAAVLNRDDKAPRGQTGPRGNRGK